MTFQQKQNIISLFLNLVVTIPYLIYIFSKYQNENIASDQELKFWTTAFLILIPIRVIAEIIMNIISAILTSVITGKEESSFTDERDKLIELKGTRNTFYVFILGFCIALVTAGTRNSIGWMFAILIITGMVSELIGILSQLYYYKKGV